MKSFLGACLVLAMVILSIYIYKAYKEAQHKLAAIVGKILILGFTIVFFNIVSLYTESEGVCLFAYSMYFIAADWMLYFLLHFSLEYIGSTFDKHVKRKAMIALLVMDSCSLLLNNVLGHLFEVEEVIISSGELFFEVNPSLFFYIHLGIILMLATFCVISLMYKAFTAPVFYRKKFFVIAFVMLAIVVVNLITFHLAIDVSVVGYAIEGICIYYCAFVYTPQRLLSKTLFMVADDMSVGLMTMDLEGKRVYSNNYAEGLLESGIPVVDEDGVSLEQWCYEKCMVHKKEFEKELTFYRNEEEVFLKIQMQRMVDSNKQFQGCYFIIQDRTEEINQMKEEIYQANHDSLTGLYNKEYFYKMAEKYIKEHPDKELVLACSDIKDFKLINDVFGAKTGDKVLIKMADMLRNRIKVASVYGRLENDIFAALMAKEDFSENFCESEMQRITENSLDEDVSFNMMNYIGVYEIKERDLPIDVMCDRAKMAIATIKGDLQKRVAYYEDSLRNDILYEQELIADLPEAIAGRQLKMYLHPQVAAEGKICGAEALIRWEHPVKGLLTPGQFIPVFEKNGLITEVDMYIWETACVQLRKWKDEGKTDLYISVNISPKDFYFLDLFEIFTGLVQKYEIEPKNLKLEITETAMMMDFDRQLEVITRLQNAGFFMEMDDFGSGYSSLNMLKDIQVDVLKIDMAFLRKNQDTERSKTILRMIINLSKELGIPVIMEGVETEEQVNFLKEMDCDMFQGYFFAKPMETERFEELYM